MTKIDQLDWEISEAFASSILEPKNKEIKKELRALKNELKKLKEVKTC